MCGIASVVRFDGRPVDPTALLRIRDTMVHRGPDDAGIYVDGPVGLAHRRLSIIDLSERGHQPMSTPDGKIWLTFNGEIYNYVELAEDMRRRGHEFRTGTDTEVLLLLYQEMGEACLQLLNGMFAFTIWDGRRGRLFGARDRLGIKPFHYATTDDAFVCASEIKAILAYEGVPRRIDPQGLADFLFCGTPMADRTTFAGVKSLGPGQSIVVEPDGRVAVSEYWSLRYDHVHGRTHAQLVDELDALIADAVRVHCRSDAPLGAHLSGGLDSSTVVSLARPHRDRLKTFSIRFSTDDFYDETSWARRVSEHVGTEYVEDVPGAAQLGAWLPALLWHLDMPIPGAGGFSYFSASRLAARHVTVSLTGHGGDELFAGYPAQFQAAFGSTAAFTAIHTPTPAEVTARSRILRVLRREGLRGLVDRVAGRFGRGEPTLADTWVRLHCGPVPKRNHLLSKEFVRSLGGYSPREQYVRDFEAAPTDDALEKCMYHDLRHYLPELLHKEDRTSMSVSLESRVPLLDYRVAEYMSTVPPDQKVPNGTPKGLLRDVARRHLPDDVVDRRDKTPFPVPYGTWLQGPLRPLVEDVLHAPACLDRGIFDPDAIRSGEVGALSVMTMLSVELWCRLFLDEDPTLLDFEPLGAELGKRHVSVAAGVPGGTR